MRSIIIFLFVFCTCGYCESLIQFNDTLTGASVSIFEHSQNEDFLKQKQYSRMKFYLSPICQFVKFKDSTSYKRVALKDKVRYSLRVQYYHDSLYQQAAEHINVWLKNAAGGYQIQEPKSQIYNIAHSTVSFATPYLEFLATKTIGDNKKLVTLPNAGSVSFFIDKKNDDDFRTLLDSDVGVTFTISIEYSLSAQDYTKVMIIPTSTGSMHDLFDRTLTTTVSRLEALIHKQQRKIEELQGLAKEQAQLIMWSGGSKEHGKGKGYIRYKTDVTEFNTAQDHFLVADNGTITFKKAGYYRINLWVISQHTGIGHITMKKNSEPFYQGHDYIGNNQWSDNFADVTWEFAVGDLLWIDINSNGGGAQNAYHHWGKNGNYGRLQIQFISNSKAPSFIK